MKFVTPVILGIASIIAFSSPVPAFAAGDDHAKDKAAIQAAIEKQDKAIEKREVDAFVSVTHPDFIAIDAAGKERIHGQEALRKGMAVVFVHATKSSQHSSVNNITFTKYGAIVEFVSETKFTMVENGKTREVVESGTYRDLWVQKAGVWLDKRARAIEETFTVDGQEQAQ